MIIQSPSSHFIPTLNGVKNCTKCSVYMKEQRDKFSEKTALLRRKKPFMNFKLITSEIISRVENKEKKCGIILIPDLEKVQLGILSKC